MNEPKAQLQKTISKEVLDTSTVYLNVGQDFIATTEDRLRLCLTNYERRLGTRERWIAPVSLLPTILAVLVAADFHDFLLEKAVWKAIFVLAAIAAFVWAVVAIVKACRISVTINGIVHELKKCSESRPAKNPP